MRMYIKEENVLDLFMKEVKKFIDNEVELKMINEVYKDYIDGDVYYDIDFEEIEFFVSDDMRYNFEFVYKNNNPKLFDKILKVYKNNETELRHYTDYWNILEVDCKTNPTIFLMKK